MKYLEVLKRILEDEGQLGKCSFFENVTKEGLLSVDKSDTGFRVFYAKKGQESNEQEFQSEQEVCDYIISVLFPIESQSSVFMRYNELLCHNTALEYIDSGHEVKCEIYQDDVIESLDKLPLEDVGPEEVKNILASLKAMGMVLTPSKIKMMDREYKFCTNTKKVCAPTLKVVAELCGIDVVFVDNASDMNSKSLEDYCSVYIAEEKNKNKDLTSLVDINTMLVTEYKKVMIDRGYPVKDISLENIYIGCERNFAQ